MDIDNSGAIERADLELASSAMGWETQQGKFFMMGINVQ
jgi:hypothetical protein